LISLGKLFAQGWNPQLSRRGITLHDGNGKIIFHTPMKDNAYIVMLRATYPDDSPYAWDIADEHLQEQLHYLEAAFVGEETNKPISLLDWHRRMGHRSMRTIVKMAKGAVTGMTISDLPDRIPKLDDCAVCALAKTHRLPFKRGRTRATQPLQLVHGDLVGPMPVESIGGHKYGFLLIDDYSRASWVLPLRAKSDAPVEFEKWAKKVENDCGRNLRTVLFDNARELVAGKMKALCDARGTRIISTVPYSPSSNGVAERLVGVTSEGTRAMMHDSGLPPRFWAEAVSTFMHLRNRTPTTANSGKTPYELFHKIKPDVSHIRPFGCITKVALPTEKLGKLDHRAVMGYLIGYKYESGGYRVWIPKKGVREARDVVFYNDEDAPVLPEDGAAVEMRHAQPANLPPTTTWPTVAGPSTHTTAAQVPQESRPTSDGANNSDVEAPREKLTIRIPGRYHPRAPQAQLQHHPEASADEPPEPTPMDLHGDEADSAPRYVGRVHDFPARASRSGLVRNEGGGGAMLAYGAFEVVEPTFTPKPTTPDPQTVREALAAPDANEWTAAMDDEINNMRRLGVFKEVPRPIDKNVITPQWVFRRKFENGALIRYKARLVARGFTQVPGIDYHESYLYVPVVRLESSRILISIAALFDLDLRQFDVSAAYLHGDIDGEVYMEPPAGYQKDDLVWQLLKGLYGLKQAGRIWHERLKADMQEIGFTNAQEIMPCSISELGGTMTGPHVPSGPTMRRE
jgi:hypothetical protein